MSIRKITLSICIGLLSMSTANSQLFETRSTNYGGEEILEKLKKNGSETQTEIRDSILKLHSDAMGWNDTIETFYDDYHLGLVIYRDSKPFELLGFWNPKGELINGGELKNGNGTIKTPFNSQLIQNFKSESVIYVSGLKKGEVFYYCDCANVLRRGVFVNNQKSGLWKEYAADGSFIKQKKLKIIHEPIKIEQKRDFIDYRQPSHCMMRNPDEKIICPKG